MLRRKKTNFTFCAVGKDIYRDSAVKLLNKFVIIVFAAFSRKEDKNVKKYLKLFKYFPQRFIAIILYFFEFRQAMPLVE